MTYLLALLVACGMFAGTPMQAHTPTQAPVKGVSHVLHAQPIKSSTLTRCEEDMPCWNCKTMGNKQCGPAKVKAYHPAIKAHAKHAPVKAHKPSIKAPKPLPKPSAPNTGYDCDTRGLTLCYSPDMGDAWESFDSVDVYDSATQPLAYTSTTHTQPTQTKTTLVVKSINLPKTWHIFTFI